MRIEINLSEKEYATFKSKIIRIIEDNKTYELNGHLNKRDDLIDTYFANKGEGRIILTSDENEQV